MGTCEGHIYSKILQGVILLQVLHTNNFCLRGNIKIKIPQLYFCGDGWFLFGFPTNSSGDILLWTYELIIERGLITWGCWNKPSLLAKALWF